MPHIIDENEQYMCLPQFMTTKDGEKVALEIKKIASADKKKIPTISILNTSLISPLIALT